MMYLAPVLAVVAGVILAALTILCSRVLSQRWLCWLAGLGYAIAAVWVAWSDPYYTAAYAYFDPPRTWLPVVLMCGAIFSLAPLADRGEA